MRCFYRLMQALSDDQRLERLEKKVDNGFLRLEAKIDDGLGEMRAEFRAMRAETGSLHRLVIQLFAGTTVTMILGFAGIILSHS